MSGERTLIYETAEKRRHQKSDMANSWEDYCRDPQWGVTSTQGKPCWPFGQRFSFFRPHSSKLGSVVKKENPCCNCSKGLPCDPGRIRTPNPQSRNLIFYPVELLGHFFTYELNLALTMAEMVFPSA